MKFTTVATDAFQKFQLNAGVLLTEFDPTDPDVDRSKIIGATSGGTAFTATPTYTDFGEDVDNVPANTMELKVLESVEATMSGTFKTIDNQLAKRLMAAADLAANGKIVPRANLKLSDFEDIWWVGDYSDKNTGDSAGFLAIKLINALSTGGFSIQPNDKAKGDFAFTFTGHYSIGDMSVLPYEIYLQAGTSASTDATLSALSLGTATLSPTFAADTVSYAASTTSSTNTITATPNDSGATVVIKLDNAAVTGTTLTWGNNGEHTVTVMVTAEDGETTKTYTITVTKSSE